MLLGTFRCEEILLVLCYFSFFYRYTRALTWLGSSRKRGGVASILLELLRTLDTWIGEK